MMKMNSKLYALIDCIDDKLIKASLNREEVLAKVGADTLSGIDTNDYRLKSIRIEDMKDEVDIAE